MSGQYIARGCGSRENHGQHIHVLEGRGWACFGYTPEDKGEVMRHGLITGSRTKRVPVFDITTETDEEILDYATKVAGETYEIVDGELRGSLFGRTLNRGMNDRTYALVHLHTD